MGIPQIIVIVLTCLGLGIEMESHGKSRKPVNFWMSLASVAITQFLLWWGGFYG